MSRGELLVSRAGVILDAVMLTKQIGYEGNRNIG